MNSALFSTFHPVLLIRSPKIVDAVGITGSYYGIGDHTDFFYRRAASFMVHSLSVSLLFYISYLQVNDGLHLLSDISRNIVIVL